MRRHAWLVPVVLVAVAATLVLGRPGWLIDAAAPYAGLVARGLYILVLAAALCLYRIAAGPSAADRVVAIDIFGVLIVGVCALLAVASGHSWYLDIGIAWALQSFIGALALAKYLEGRAFDA